MLVDPATEVGRQVPLTPSKFECPSPTTTIAEQKCRLMFLLHVDVMQINRRSYTRTNHGSGLPLPLQTERSNYESRLKPSNVLSRVGSHSRPLLSFTAIDRPMTSRARNLCSSFPIYAATAKSCVPRSAFPAGVALLHPSGRQVATRSFAGVACLRKSPGLLLEAIAR